MKISLNLCPGSILFAGDIPNGCKYIRNRSECKDIDWTTYTCVLGYHVFGQYLGYMDMVGLVLLFGVIHPQTLCHCSWLCYARFLCFLFSLMWVYKLLWLRGCNLCFYESYY